MGNAAPSSQLSWVERCLHRLARALVHHPSWFVWPQLLCLVCGLVYTVRHLEFSTNRSDLVGADKHYHRNFLKFRGEFPNQDDLVVVVESENREKNRQFVERLGIRLEGETNLFTGVFYKGDLKLMGRKALLFLPEATLAELQRSLAAYRPFMNRFAQATNLNGLFRQINAQFRHARAEASEENKSMLEALPALRRILDQATASIDRPGSAPSPGITALFNAGDAAEEGQYITFAQGRLYLVSARAQTDALTGAALRRLRELVAATQREVPGVNAGLTGEPVLEHDEMRQSQSDSTKASIISLAVVAVLFVVGYRETGRPLKATVCLLVGLGYTIGYATAVVGHLNILTVTFFPILIGLAIDFGVHLISRYEEELHHGQTPEEAITTALVHTGQGVFTGCFTTAGAFFAMGLTDFKGIQEMGIITGGGLVICLIPMMTLLPVWLLRGRQNAIDQKVPERSRRLSWERLWMKRPGRTMALTVGVSVLAAVGARTVYFDYNLLHLQSKGLPAVEFEHKLIHSGSKSVLFAAVMADSIEHAVDLRDRLSRLPTVASIDAMAPFLAESPERKLALITEVKRELSSVVLPQVDPAPVEVESLAETLSYTQAYLWHALGAVRQEGQTNLVTELEQLRASIGELRRRLNAADIAALRDRLSTFQTALFEDVRQTLGALQQQDDRAGLRVEDLPPNLRDRFVGRTGKHLLQVYPKENVWERAGQLAFVSELRQVFPEVTGTPVQLLEYTTLLKQSYEKAALYALAAIAILTLLHFRSMASVVLALIPVGLGTLWTVGFMGYFDLPFNPANIMTLPLVIGIGVTNGIHILNRFMEERDPSILGKSTGKAILVSGLTTVAGFGSLILAQHQGIASLGMVMSVGVTLCMLIALTFLPSLMAWLVGKGWNVAPKPAIEHAGMIETNPPTGQAATKQC